MLIKELKTFLSVCETGSFLHAARACFLTPASVMNQMNKLESELNTKLFIRTNHGVELTATGRILEEETRLLKKEVNRIRSRIESEAQNLSSVIRIGTSILYPCTGLCKLLEEIDKGSNLFQLQLIPFDDSPGQFDKVLDHLGDTIDCLLSPCDARFLQPELDRMIIDQIPCRISMPRHHYLSQKESLDWKDLEGETLMLIREGQSETIDQIREEVRRHPKIQIENVDHFYDTKIIKDATQRGCMLVSFDLWEKMPPDLVIKKMNWDFRMPYGILYSKKANANVQALLVQIEKTLLQANREEISH